MTNPWFRMYSEFAHDPKVQMMNESMQRRYVMIMCMRCSNALVTLHETEIAFHLRISNDELAETKKLFIARGFIDERWNILNWDKRQFVSDSSAARVAKHRKNKKELGNGLVTLQKQKSNALDTDTDTDTEETKPTAPSEKITRSPPEEKINFIEGKFTNTERRAELWNEAYPAVNIKTEIAKAAAWLLANPKNAKQNHERFLSNWLSRAQEKAPAMGGGKKSEERAFVC